MRDILSAANRGVLARFAQSNVLVAFDFDGTLAPISPHRDDVSMRAGTTALLRELCALLPCAVVSGRSRADVSARLGGVAIPYVIGNHGIEPSNDLLRYEAWAAQAYAALDQRLAGEAGVELEYKRFSVTVHYRHAPSPARALRRITHAVRTLGERVRVIGGKLVVNVLPADAPHKGTALDALARSTGAELVIYAGDDDTDEDAFEHAVPGRLLGIRVGRSASSKAGYFVRDQAHVDALLEAIVTARARGADAKREIRDPRNARASTGRRSVRSE